MLDEIFDHIFLTVDLICIVLYYSIGIGKGNSCLCTVPSIDTPISSLQSVF